MIKVKNGRKYLEVDGPQKGRLKISYKQALDLGFKVVGLWDDRTYEEQYNDNWYLMEKKLYKKLTLNWNPRTHHVDILFEVSQSECNYTPILDAHHLTSIINTFLPKWKHVKDEDIIVELTEEEFSEMFPKRE